MAEKSLIIPCRTHTILNLTCFPGSDDSFYSRKILCVDEAQYIPAHDFRVISKAMDEGFDFVQVGRATIRDPNIVRKMEQGEVQSSDCDHCNRCVGEINSGPVRCVCLDEGRALPA